MHHVRLSYSELVKELKKNTEGFKVLNIAVLADFASQHYAKALRAALVSQQFNPIIWEADYNSVDAYIFNEDSDLYKKHFDYIVIIPSARKLNKEFSHESQKSEFADQKINHINNLVTLLIERTRSKIIFTNFQ